MFTTLMTTSLLCMLPAAPLPDDNASLIDRAIRAQGGAEKLSNAQGMTWTMKATVKENDQIGEVSGEFSAQSTDRIRWKATLKQGDMNHGGVLVITPDNIWAKSDEIDKTEEAPRDNAFIRDTFRAIRLAQNVSALRSTDNKISYLGASKIEDRPVMGLRITAKDRPDIELFLDKTTSLPVCVQLRVTEPMETNAILYSFSFADYKDFGGLKHFTHMTFKRDDKVLMEVECGDVQYREKLDPTLFAKP